MKIKSVDYDTSYTPGCSTCDYGSRYHSFLDLEYDDGTKLDIRIRSSNGNFLSESDMIIILANSSSPEEVIKEIREKIKDVFEYGWDKGSYYSLNGTEVLFKDVQ